MDTKTLVNLATDGNLARLEERWIEILEQESTTPETALELLPVFETLATKQHRAEADTLATTTLDLLADRFSPRELLRAAGPLLLTLGDSAELRRQVTALFRTGYQDRAAIDVLLEEAGLAGGRPVRRALRTLDVCLSVSVGDYLVARHDDTTARIAAFDDAAWGFSLETRRGQRELGPVELADQYAPAEPDDYRVLRDFEPLRLAELGERDPTRILLSILKHRSEPVSSDTFKALLCPEVVPAERWTRWWSKARAAAKRCPHIDVEGRSPYYLSYREEARTLEQECWDGFRRLAGAKELLGAVENYLRECRTRKQEPDRDLLLKMDEELGRRARRLRSGGLTLRLVQRRVESLLEADEAAGAAVDMLRAAPDPVVAIQGVEVTALWSDACDCLAEALPDRITEVLAALLPVAPLPVCGGLAERLGAAGFGEDDFEALAARILGDPLRYHAGLLWLWDGAPGGRVAEIRSLSLLSTILAVLGDLKREGTVPRKQAQAIAADVRKGLAARKYERFQACLEEIDPPMARALRTQIRRLDSLGRATREDLSKLLRKRFPELDIVPIVKPWEDPNVVWTTGTGLLTKQQEIDELVNVKMKENAKRIGEAAALGDLAENSEYKFALEERDLLRARLAQMQDSVGLARKLTREDVPTDHVGVGSTVTFRHAESGNSPEMTFLGPWDADIERHVYNYKAPFSQAIMGKTVGDTVELDNVSPPGRYEIVNITNSML